MYITGSGMLMIYALAVCVIKYQDIHTALTCYIYTSDQRKPHAGTYISHVIPTTGRYLVVGALS